MKPFYKIILFFFAALICAFFLGRCTSIFTETTTDASQYVDSLKKENTLIKRDRDSLLWIALTTDTTRVKIITKWRTFKGQIDSIPCDSAIPILIVLTDSIITVDSTEIVTLKQVIRKDSMMLANDEKIMYRDSVTIQDDNKQIAKLQRKVKRNRLIAGIATGIAAVEAAFILLVR